MTRRYVGYVALLGVVVATVGGQRRTGAADPAPSVSLRRIETPDFLTVPPALEGKPGFRIARTAPTIDIHVFEGLPSAGPKTLWSNWGDGCVASNGRYYFALGNHLGPEGQSYLYEYDPHHRTVRAALDLREALPESKERYAAGKVHSRIDQGKDGLLYFSTYWGKIPKEADFQAGYLGSVLLRYDPSSGRSESLGAIVPGQGLPTSLLDPRRMIQYFTAVYSGDFVAYDLTARKVLYRGSGDQQEGSRNLMLDAAGHCYFSTADGFLARYSPSENRVTRTRAQLPLAAGAAPGKTGGRFLRASTRPARNGRLFGMTKDGALFAFDPKTDMVTELGANFLKGEYVAVMALSPDEKYLYYAPGAHGQSARYGTPVVQYDLAKRERKVLAFLNAPLRDRLRWNVGGTYNLKCSADGSRLYIAFNGAPLDPNAGRELTFGQPGLIVLNIPASER